MDGLQLVWKLVKRSEDERHWFAECGRFSIDDYRRGVKRRYRLSVRNKNGEMEFVAGYCSSTSAKKAAERQLRKGV